MLKSFAAFPLILLICAASAAVAAPRHEAGGPGQGRDLLGALPLRFEANRGQWPSDVRFAARSSEHGVALTSEGATVQVPEGDTGRHTTIRIRALGASNSMRVEPAGKLASGSTYMLGNDRAKWQSDVPHYSSVAYRGVYPGIDLIYKGAGRRLEYDFLVAPRADASRIHLRFEGASELKLSAEADGALVIRTAGGGELRQPLPYAFQESVDGAGSPRTRVEARYRIVARNEVTFELGAYDHDRLLTIDPVLVATYFGGDNTDVATAVAIDIQGQVWVTGYTSSASLPLTDNPYSSSRSGNLDLFVAKFNPAVSGVDSLVWSTYIGGDNADRATAIAVSPDFIHIVGDTMSTNFPRAGSEVQSNLKGDTDAFLIRIRRTQQGVDSLWYATYLGGNQRDYATAVAVDSRDRSYVAGYATFGEEFPFAGGTLQRANRGGYDAFFAVIFPGSPLVYSTFLGGTKTDVATGIAVDEAGIVHLTGYTMSDDFPATPGAYRTLYAGRGDVFYARADITKSGLDGLLYATYIGGSDADIAYGMAADRQGRLYLTGYTFSPDFPVTGAAVVQAQKSGGADVFLMRLDPAATPAASLIGYATYLGGSGSELAYGIALTPDGSQVAVTGYTDSSNFPTRGEPLQPRFGGGLDGFLAVLNLSAAQPLVYASYVGGDSPDVGYQVTADARGNFYMVGSTTSRRLASSTAFQTDLSRYTDGFLVRFNLCTDRVACEAQGLIVAASAESPALNTAAAADEACIAPGGLTLSLEGARCAAADSSTTVLCTRKVCSPSGPDAKE